MKGNFQNNWKIHPGGAQGFSPALGTRKKALEQGEEDGLRLLHDLQQVWSDAGADLGGPDTPHSAGATWELSQGSRAVTQSCPCSWDLQGPLTAAPEWVWANPGHGITGSLRLEKPSEIIKSSL